MSSKCYYQLKIGDLWLAPRASITVIESDDFEALTPKDEGSGCANCGGDNAISRREIVIKLRYRGRGSLATAWHMYNQTEAVLNAGCALNLQIGFERRVCDEPWLKYNIRSSYQRQVDTWSQRTCDRILTVELHLNLVAYNAAKLVDFGGGPFNSSFASSFA